MNRTRCAEVRWFTADETSQEKIMNFKLLTRFPVVALLAILTMAFQLGGQENQDNKADNSEHKFQLTSMTFANGAPLPLSMIFDASGCAANGAIGGDQSPEMSWTRPKQGTRSFVVILYDVTAAFTHWGMYNISPEATGVPANAGVAGSMLGQQVENDFFLGEQYDGPCPPTTVTPTTHEYVLTVYALDEELHLDGSANFPPAGETLFRELVKAGRDGHILESSSLRGSSSAVSTTD
jgi:Raf kinase inhibitor-like YbhB/YbcL family protein